MCGTTAACRDIIDSIETANNASATGSLAKYVRVSQYGVAQ
jgi:hypothetical protein